MAFDFTNVAPAVNLVNEALAHLKGRSLTGATLDANSNDPEKAVNNVFHSSIKKVLRDHKWNCVAKEAALSTTTANTASHWLYAYTLPTDYIRLIDIYLEDQPYIPTHGYPEQYSINNDKLMTNATSVDIRYVYYPSATSDSTATWTTYFGYFDPGLWDACVLHLAYKLAPSRSEMDRSITNDLYALFKEGLRSARTQDAQEGPNHIVHNSTLIRARL